MNTKTILLAGFGAASLYFGGSVLYDDKKIENYYNTHNTLKQYLYLEQYEGILNRTWMSYSTLITKHSEGKAKEQAQKVEKDLELALVHVKQQKLLLEDKELLSEIKGLDKLTREREQDNLFFYLSLFGFGGVFLWKWVSEEE